MGDWVELTPSPIRRASYAVRPPVGTGPVVAIGHIRLVRSTRAGESRVRELNNYCMGCTL